MHKGAGGLDQSFEKIIVVAIAVKPNLLQDVVRFVVALVIPTAKVGTVKWMVLDLTGRIDVVALELAHKLRNPLAFAHEGLNFSVPQMMGKPTFPEGHDSSPRRVRPLADVRDRTQE